MRGVHRGGPHVPALACGKLRTLDVQKPTRKDWDAAFPTIVRYAGIALTVFYAVGSAFGLEIPESVLIAATGLILYKSVSEGVRNGGSGNGNGGKNDGSP